MHLDWGASKFKLQVGLVGYVYARHSVDLFLGRRSHVDALVGLHLDGPWGPAPLGQRRDLEACLDFVDRVVVVGPSVLVRPMIQTWDVGALMRCVSRGSLNSSMNLSIRSGRQPAGATRKCWASVPVVHQPGDANTSVHMSSIGIR